jgi:ABC-type phosphate/phosphonate transport system substrate-binding protein
MPEAEKKQLQDVFLAMHDDPEGEKILQGMNIQRFVLGEDSAYDSIRKMRNFIKENQGH